MLALLLESECLNSLQKDCLDEVVNVHAVSERSLGQILARFGGHIVVKCRRRVVCPHCADWALVGVEQAGEVVGHHELEEFHRQIHLLQNADDIIFAQHIVFNLLDELLHVFVGQLDVILPHHQRQFDVQLNQGLVELDQVLAGSDQELHVVLQDCGYLDGADHVQVRLE